MVVDDDSDVLEVIQKALRKWDMPSDGFTDPGVALGQFQQNPDRYSLVISDLKMPMMHGFEFLERITGIKPDIRVMVMTAYFKDMVEIPMVLRGILGIDAVLQKPSGLRKVCEDVKRQLELV